MPVPPVSAHPSPVEGVELGAVEGALVGVLVGMDVGLAVGVCVGFAVGAVVGVETVDALAFATVVDVAATVGGSGATSGVAMGSGSFRPM